MTQYEMRKRRRDGEARARAKAPWLCSTKGCEFPKVDSEHCIACREAARKAQRLAR